MNESEIVVERNLSGTLEYLKNVLPDEFARSTPTEATFSPTYIPVFLIVVALIIIIGMYVYDVFNDIVEGGGIFKWKNDTISLHCSETTSNQFRFLLAASILFSIGLIWLLAWEAEYRTYSKISTLWYAADMLAAVCFMMIGIFPTHGDTTKLRVGQEKRERDTDADGNTRCVTTVEYKPVKSSDRLIFLTFETRITRVVSKWIHIVTSLYAMIELTASNLGWSFVTLGGSDNHAVIFRTLSSLNLAALIGLVTIQGIVHTCCISNAKIRAILYILSMASELATLLLAVVTTMLAILHRDPKVLWIFSTCYGVKV